MASVLALLPVPRQRYWTQNGKDPLAGGVMQFFEVGTSTPKPVFADPQGEVTLGVEVELDGFGYLPAIYISPSGYRVVLLDVQGVQQWDVDGVHGPGAGGSLVGGGSGEADHVVVTDGDGGIKETVVMIDAAGNMTHVRDFTFTGRLIMPTAAGVITLAAGLNHNVVIPDATVINVSVPDGIAEVTGVTGGVDGRVVYFRHTGGFEFHTLGEHDGSGAINRFVEASLNIAYGQLLAMHYNGATSRWFFEV